MTERLRDSVWWYAYNALAAAKDGSEGLSRIAQDYMHDPIGEIKALSKDYAKRKPAGVQLLLLLLLLLCDIALVYYGLRRVVHTGNNRSIDRYCRCCSA